MLSIREHLEDNDEPGSYIFGVASGYCRIVGIFFYYYKTTCGESRVVLK